MIRLHQLGQLYQFHRYHSVTTIQAALNKNAPHRCSNTDTTLTKIA